MGPRALTLSLLFVVAACGEKTPPTPAVEEAVAEAPAAPEPEAEADPEPEPAYEPPPPADNADLKITVNFSDGTSKSGHVKRIERSADWYAEEGWETDAGSLKIELEGNGTLKEVTWSDLTSISVSPGKVPGDVDCTYSSDYTPWMYTCTLRTPSTAKTSDGKSWTVNTRHKWRFTYDDDSQVEFWLAKHPARMQDEKVVELDDDIGENYDMYTQLQDQLRQEVGGLVKSVSVSAP